MHDQTLTVRQRNRRRLVFTALVLVPYFLFAAQYLPAFSFMSLPLLENNPFTRSLGYFCLLIVGFVALEYVYLRSREKEDERD